MNILITGVPGSGKTTLVQAIVKQLKKEFNIDGGGFYTKEIRSGKTRMGFSLVTLEGKAATLAHVEIQSPCKVGRYGVDIGILDGIGVAAIKRAICQKEIIVIDEIGKMELFSARFQQSVLEAFDDTKAVLATIGKLNHPFATGLKNRGDICLLEASRENQDYLRTKIINLIIKSLEE